MFWSHYIYNKPYLALFRHFSGFLPAICLNYLRIGLEYDKYFVHFPYLAIIWKSQMKISQNWMNFVTLHVRCKGHVVQFSQCWSSASMFCHLLACSRTFIFFAINMYGHYKPGLCNKMDTWSGKNKTSVLREWHNVIWTRIYLLVVGVSPSSVHSYLSPVLNSLSIITGFLSAQELWTLLLFAFLTGGPELQVVSIVLK